MFSVATLSPTESSVKFSTHIELKFKVSSQNGYTTYKSSWVRFGAIRQFKPVDIVREGLDFQLIDTISNIEKHAIALDINFLAPSNRWQFLFISIFRKRQI